MILSDDKVIINTQGIRYVHKLTGYKADGSPLHYRLIVQYKGNSLSQLYENEQDRDNMFNQLKEGMEKKK